MSNDLDPDQDRSFVVPEVCKGYQQTTKVVANKVPYRLNFNSLPATYNRLLKNFPNSLGAYKAMRKVCSDLDQKTLFDTQMVLQKDLF